MNTNEASTDVVLDSSALLAYLNGEVGQVRVQEILELAQIGKIRAHLSLINLGEVLYITERRRGLTQAQRVLGLVESLPLAIHAVTREQVLDAAHLKANHAISYADAFATALAQAEHACVLTVDPEFESVGKLVQLEWLR